MGRIGSNSEGTSVNSLKERPSQHIKSPPVSHTAQIEYLKSNKSSLTTSTVCINAELDDFLESALIHAVKVVNEDLFDFSDSICAVCETGGDLICCDGRCLRAFHLSCIGLQEEDVPDDVPFNCSDCLNFVQRCFLCKQFAFEENMVKCKNVRKILSFSRGYESENVDHPISFICKLHSCDICNDEMHSSSLSKLKQPWRCFRCPKAYDAKHRPKDVHILMEGIFLCIRHIQEEEEMPELPVELQLAIAEKHLKNRDFNSLLSQSLALSDSIETHNNEDRSKLKCITTVNNSTTNSINSSTSNPTLSNSNGKVNYEVELILEKQRQQALHEGIKELLDHSATPQNILIPRKRKAVEVVVTTSSSSTTTRGERDNNNNNNNSSSHDEKLLCDVDEEVLHEHDIKSLGKKTDDTSTTSSFKNHQTKNKLKNNNIHKTEAIDNTSEISSPNIHMESNNNRSRWQHEKIPYEDDFRYHSNNNNKKKNESIKDTSSSSRSSIDNSSSRSRNNSWTEKKRRYESSDSKDDNGDGDDGGEDYYRYHCHRNTTTTSSSREYNDMGQRQQRESHRCRNERVTTATTATATATHGMHHQYHEEWVKDYQDKDKDKDVNEDDEEKGHSYRSQRGFHNMKEHEMAMDNVPTAAIILQNHKKGCRRIHTAPYKTSQQLLTQSTNIVSTTNRSYSDNNTYDGNDQLRNNYDAFNATNSSGFSSSNSVSSAPNYRSSSTGMSRTARLLSGNFMNETFANNQRTFRQHYLEDVTENISHQQPVVASKNSFVGALIRNVDDDTNANSYHDTKEKLPMLYSTRSGTSSNGGIDTPNCWQEKRNRLGGARSSRGDDQQEEVRFNSNINTLDSRDSSTSSNYTRKYAGYDYSSNGTATTSPSRRARFTSTTAEANGRRGGANTFISQPSLAPGENSGYYSNHNSHQQLDRFTNEEQYVSTRSANIDESGLVTDLYYPITTTSRAVNGTEALISSRYAGKNHSGDDIVVRGSSSTYFKHNNYYSDENSKNLLSVDAYPPAEQRPTNYLQNSVIVAPKNFDCSTSKVSYHHRHLTSESDYFHTCYDSSIEHVITNNSIGYNREIGGRHHNNFVEQPATYLTAAHAGGCSQTSRTSILDGDASRSAFGGHQINYKQSPHVVRGLPSNIRIANKDKGGNILSGSTASSSATTSSAPIVDINDLFTQLQSCGLLPS